MKISLKKDFTVHYRTNVSAWPEVRPEAGWARFCFNELFDLATVTYLPFYGLPQSFGHP